MKRHDPPEVYKQYERKPTREVPQDSSSVSSDVDPPKDTPSKEKKPRKPMLPDDRRTKSNLVKAMGYEHPFRTLDVGSVNANASRAAKRSTYPDGINSERVLEEVKTCLTKVAGHATAVKRTAQLALGQYLENLPLHNLDSNDMIILRHLCPQYSVQEKAAIRSGAISDLLKAERSRDNNYDDPDDGAGDEASDDTGSSNKSKPNPVFFFQLLLTALYNRRSTSGESPAAEAVQSFLEKARVHKYLPLESARGKVFLYSWFVLLILSWFH